MKAATQKTTISVERSASLGITDTGLAERLICEIYRLANRGPITVATTLAQLHEQLRRKAPRVILLEDAVLEGAPLAESLRHLTETAPVILLAGSPCPPEVARLVAEGEVEFVARVGDFLPLAASLVERRLRWDECSECALGPPWAELSGDVAEIFRHEINNPLTGILGNAELLLAHRDRLPLVDAQRLQTIVDLAVRLRETTRRISNAWESQYHSLKSA
jgi:signal transduction histidine kinase